MKQDQIAMDMTQEEAAKDMVYEKATAEVIYFDNVDVITTSGGSSVSCYINVF